MVLEDVLGHEGIMPQRPDNGAACFDLAIPTDIEIRPQTTRLIPLLLAFDIPQGYCLHVYGRSSMFVKHSLIIPTSIIDYGYRDGIHGFVYSNNDECVWLNRGDRVFQAQVIPLVGYKLVETIIPQSERGGLGSSGV
jgi:dUTP pyrophosphatase